MQVECLHSISSWIEAFDYMLLCYREVSGQDISDNGWRKKAQKKEGISIFEVPGSDICKHGKSRLARGNLFSHSFIQRCTVTGIKGKKGFTSQ